MNTKLTEAQKQANKLARQQAREQQKEAQRIEAEINQKPVKEITFTIEWKASRMWGSNPNLECIVIFKDGSSERSQIFKASGCGYCKESTVIAEAFNKYLKYKLYEKNEKLAEPYGINLYSDYRGFSGGIGTSCYYRISEAINGKFEHTASGKTFDVFRYIDND